VPPLRERLALTFAKMGKRHPSATPFPLRQAIIKTRCLREDIARLG
jgi:hypothetical protein